MERLLLFCLLASSWAKMIFLKKYLLVNAVKKIKKISHMSSHKLKKHLTYEKLRKIQKFYVDIIKQYYYPFNNHYYL